MAKNFGKNLQGKTIAVYGASSNIGSKFVLEAAKRGAIVIAVARDISKVPSLLKPHVIGSIEVVKGDITRKPDIRKALRGRDVYATINFAADFSTNLSNATAVNVVGEKNLIAVSTAFDVKRHIYISTIATLRRKPSVYGDTKRKAEEVVKVFGKKLDWIILRYTNVLGTRAWDEPFKIIFPYVRIAVPKVPTDAKDAVFHYVTIETAVQATLAALDCRPNQTITVLDGETTIGEYISFMEKVYDVRLSFLPGKLLELFDKLFGKYIPLITGLYAGVEFFTHPPALENETMKRELQVGGRHFKEWAKTHLLST